MGVVATAPSTFRSLPRYHGCRVIYSSLARTALTSAREMRAVGSGTRMRDSRSFSSAENQLRVRTAEGDYGGHT